MKARKKLLYLFTLITLVSLATDVRAKCPVAHPGPPCQEYWRADAVFIGVVTRVVHTPNTTGLAIGPYLRTTVYFTIDEALKGVTGTEIVFDLDHCGFQFEKNERYLVYAHLNRNSNKLEVREGNTRTQPLSRAARDLTYIRGLRSKPSSTVYGTVTQYTYNVQEKYFDAEPLPNINVILEGNNQRKEVVTDSEGRYEFKGVQAGTYRIRAEFPAYLSYEEQTVKLTTQQCVDVDIVAMRGATPTMMRPER